MASKSLSLSWLLLISLASTLLLAYSVSQNDRKAYIVYMGNRKMDEVSTSSLHTSMLQEAIGSNVGPESLLYSYSRSFNGFVVKLAEQEAQKMAGMDGVVSVFPNELKKLHTTRSWDFLGFPHKVQRTTVESNIIIGVLDTGIWPESDSFNDKGFGLPPSKWRATCQASTNFTCNNKIIGAKYYNSLGEFDETDVKSPRDSEGHGSHIASTAGGSVVDMASVQGVGLGTARGAVPSARIAVYKVCWSFGCYDADILAAFDDAIADGVDIISISVGGSAGTYFTDSISIGAFHAMRNGILASSSIGNKGPGLATITNFAPWSLSVAASSIDRTFVTEVQLGNKKIYQGLSINPFDLKNKTYPIIYGGDAPNTTEGDAGSRGPIATIRKTSECKDTFAPYIPPFSSRGPNPSTSNILKPDLAAPGVNILAAWSPISPISEVDVDKKALSYNIQSGTSMACPHASRLAAYIKSIHPTWFPAAIKSALMTIGNTYI